MTDKKNAAPCESVAKREPNDDLPHTIVPTNDATDVELTTNDAAEIARLARLTPIQYDRRRMEEAERLGCRIQTLDLAVIAQRKNLQQQAANATDNELYNGIEPWETPVDGLMIANEIKSLLQRYTVASEGGHVAVTLWILGSYVFDHFGIFPKLCLSSPEKRCGKTTMMEVIAATVRRELTCSNSSAAFIFRAIEAWTPTLLLDEGDTYLNGKEELRGIINSGHKRTTAYVGRVEEIGGERLPKRFSTWAPMAIAMINKPASTIRDRSVIISLHRKLPNEKTSRMPTNLFSQCRSLRQKCQRWANDVAAMLGYCDPHVPSLGNDRAEDNWLPLLAIADALGGEWPTAARTAAISLEVATDDDDDSGAMVLRDIQQIFIESSVSRMHSGALVRRLVELEGRPWCEWCRGNPLTNNSLARMLKPYKVKSKQLKIESVNRHGYELPDFKDAFARYLPPTTTSDPIPTATTLPPSNCAGYSDIQNATEGDSVAFQNRLQTSNDDGCSVVAFQNGVKDVGASSWCDEDFPY